MKLRSLWLLGCLLLSGCVLYPREVVWLPDSSGFLYVPEDGSLKVWDVETAQEKEIISAKDANSFHPSLSPDGKTLAVMRVKQRHAGILMNAMFYDLVGNVIDQSPRFFVPYVAKPDDVDPEELVPTVLYWSPDGQHLLGCLPDGSLSQFSYDLKSRAFQLHPFVLTFEFWQFFHGPSFIRSDSAGFVARYPITGDIWITVFVKWDGSFRFLWPDLSMLHVSDWVNRTGSQEHTAERPVTLGLFPDVKGYWEGNVAMIPHADGVIKYDTNRGRVTFEQNNLQAKLLGDRLRDRIWQSHTFKETGIIVRCRILEAIPDELRAAEGENRGKIQRLSRDWLSIEVQAEGKKTSTLIQGAWTPRLPMPFIVSPDGKHVVCTILLGRADKQMEKHLVINSEGKIMHEIVTNRVRTEKNE